ncbi:hypothetical protein Btru_008235 [Bulinus truncatus]|nr:hypothetical protein Btru_008235 [Bulinus truncatus]
MSFKDKPKRPLSGIRKLASLPQIGRKCINSTIVHKGRNSIAQQKGNKSSIDHNVLQSTKTTRLVRQVAALRFQEWQRFTESLPQLDTGTKHDSKPIPKFHLPVQSHEIVTKPETPFKGESEKKVHHSSLGLPRLRRPTLIAPTPATEGGDLFKVILKGKELKPFSFQGDQLRAIQFYASHYPLLMRKILNSRGSLPGSAKAITGSDVVDALKVNSADVRNRRLHEWLASMEECLRRFETDPEDEGAIETVLRSELFDPTMWLWNKDKYHPPEITS